MPKHDLFNSFVSLAALSKQPTSAIHRQYIIFHRFRCIEIGVNDSVKQLTNGDPVAKMNQNKKRGKAQATAETQNKSE